MRYAMVTNLGPNFRHGDIFNPSDVTFHDSVHSAAGAFASEVISTRFSDMEDASAHVYSVDSEGTIRTDYPEFEVTFDKFGSIRTTRI